VDVLLSLLALFALGAPIGLAGSALIGRGPQMMAGLFGGPQTLGWPRGVQEEDPSYGSAWHVPPPRIDDLAGSRLSAGTGPARIISRSSEAPLDGQLNEPVVYEGADPAGAVPILRPISAHVGPGTSRLRSSR
jgi:hypothetical protein